MRTIESFALEQSKRHARIVQHHISPLPIRVTGPFPTLPSIPMISGYRLFSLSRLSRDLVETAFENAVN
jgi:hypothetical protein